MTIDLNEMIFDNLHLLSFSNKNSVLDIFNMYKY